ncbi:hypothetical protein DV737_g227, partial [Chaetothyriales sp. CBS 132003]
MEAFTSTQYLTLASGIKVFYRSAGPATGPVVLLLHGFPTSSTQYRNLIPILAHTGYRVIAPDLPGFGFTEVPASLNYTYSFANLADTVASFVETLHLAKYAIYIMDYGSPTGLRLALKNPSAVTAIITQNGNAYEDGLGSFWDPVRAYWASTPGSAEDKDLRGRLTAALLTYEATKWQYTDGEAQPEAIDPASYTLDWALLQRPGNFDVQLDLFRSYETNVALYPDFHAYFRSSQVPLLAAWGKNDKIFIEAGAQAFKRDLPKAEVVLLDAGHFASESRTEELGKLIVAFLVRNGIK